MKTTRLVLFFLLGAVATGFVLLKRNESPTVNPKKMTESPAEPEKLLRHVVLFKFKDGATPEQIKQVEDAFRALPSKVKEIKGLEWGTNNSPENLAQGFTHCFFVTFASEKDRAAYLPHPDHQAFGKVLGPHLDKVLVVDYWAAK